MALPRTRWFEPGERPDGAAVAEVCGDGKGVLKPRISGTAYATFVVEGGTRLAEPQWRPLERWGSLLQAFVPEIAGGEVSLIFVSGRFSHAVLKRPAAGEFRVQNDHGGTIEPFAPHPSLLAFAERAIAAAGRPWLYARVDVVETANGPLLMELEMLEPDLFFIEGRRGPGVWPTRSWLPHERRDLLTATEVGDSLPPDSDSNTPWRNRAPPFSHRRPPRLARPPRPQDAVARPRCTAGGSASASSRCRREFSR